MKIRKNIIENNSNANFLDYARNRQYIAKSRNASECGSIILILMNAQVSLTLGCPMDLALFPLDTQTCHLTIASYGWAANDLVYLWKVEQIMIM